MSCTNLESHHQMLDMDDSTSLILGFLIIFQSDKQAHPLFTYLVSSLPFEGFDETHSVAKILVWKIYSSIAVISDLDKSVPQSQLLEGDAFLVFLM